MDVSFYDGYAEVDVETWTRYLDLIGGSGFDDGWIFRGHARKSYQLVTSFTRAAQARGIDPDTALKDRHLQRFREAMRGRLTLSDRLARSDEEIWAIGQHQGLATPLLDWTESPIVAAYFAFADDRLVSIRESDPPPSSAQLKALRDEPRSIFALNARSIENRYYEMLARYSVTLFGDELARELQDCVPIVYANQGYDDIGVAVHSAATGKLEVAARVGARCRRARDAVLLDFIQLVRPESGENARLVQQRGLFTFCWVMWSIEGLVSSRYKGTKEPVLMKINLPNSVRKEALMALKKMNVGWLSLFPDLHGSAQHCNSVLSVRAAQLDWSSLGKL